MSARRRLPPPAALVLVFALLLGFSGACAKPDRADRGAAPSPGGEGELPAAAAGEGSLFELAFPLTDSEGRTRHLAEFAGEPFVASMIYTNCTSVCPRITADLQSLDRALPAPVRARTRFVLFSLDPERDTPAALRRFAADHGLDPGRWTMLAAGADDMRTIAAVLGVRFRPDGGGQIAHSAVVVVVDSAGVIRRRQVGVQNDPAPLVAAIEAVQRGAAGPIR